MDIHDCAAILQAKRTHYLKHVSYDQYSWKYRKRIWEELRPLKIGKLDYGTSNALFIITRKRVCRREIIELCAFYKNN